MNKQLWQVLEKGGYELFIEESPKAIQEVMRNIEPDLVLMDYSMTEKIEDDLCKEIKKYSVERGKFIPIILLFTLSDFDNKLAGLDNGADDFLIKPPSPKELLARVRNLLRVCDLQDNLRETNVRLERAQRIIEREINIVGQIQRSFLPRTFPSHPNLRLAARYQPSTQAGGDYYDVVSLDENRWGIVIADIAGHGVSAAVVMALTQMAVKEFSSDANSPQEALKIFNEKLNRHLSSEHFVTMFYSILDLRTMELTYASAGHYPMMFYSAHEHRVKMLEIEPGFPLRTFNSERYEQKNETLKPGDKILLFTDGVTDVFNLEKEFYGVERLKETFLRNCDTSPEVLVQTIYHDTEIFRKGKTRLDDFTLMVICRT
ncbi:MAG: SpoIIE family protein phosphatase [Candidatus Omnitrophota bacterium]